MEDGDKYEASMAQSEGNGKGKGEEGGDPMGPDIF